MTAPRIAFDRPRQSCAACGGDLPAGDAPPRLRIALTPAGVDVDVCGACRARIVDDGLPPPPFVPEFRFHGGYRIPLATADDFVALLRVIAKSAGDLSDAERERIVARASEPKVADHDAFLARVQDVSARPRAIDVAALLASGALLGIEPEPADVLRTRVDRAGAADELLACFGAYCARVARVAQLGGDTPPLTTRARRLLEAADKSLLFATLPASHPLAVRVSQIRIAVTIALDRGPTADALLLRAGHDDPRSQLLRGLRFAQQDHHGAADREFRAAVENPFAGFDPEIDGAAIWNRTVRALTATRFDEARGALRTYCRMVPRDRAARIVLGHAYVQVARDAVAREVLDSVIGVDARNHLQHLATDTDFDPEMHAEGTLLFASCLLALGDAPAAWKALERELEDGLAGTTRRAELLRLAARCALAQGDGESALDRLAVAWPIDPSAAVAHEIAWTAARAAHTALERRGLDGLFDLLERHPWLGGALRKRYGAYHALMFATFTAQQLRSGFRSEAGFGLDWSWLGARGADAQTSTFQAYASLARHQVPNALQHALTAEGAGGAGVPFALIAALFDAARRAAPEQVARLVHVLAAIAQAALRDLEATR